MEEHKGIEPGIKGMHLYDSDEPGDAENGHAELADENVLTSVSGDSERYTHEAGIVEVIFMQDFMCHRKLTVNFGRHVNFITGANGSGKSAIVAALQLCLGCTARKTGRGDSLSSMIRSSSDGPAIIRVTLMNEGPEAFMPEDYGNRITVERRIPKTGAAPYHLFSASGVLKSSRKRDLDRMLTKFNINVENPTAVLTQDEAKRFIQGKEKDKYNFFLKATLLEKTREEIRQTEDNVGAANAKVNEQLQKLKVKEHAVEELKHKLAEFEEVSKINEKIKSTVVEMRWVIAKERRNLLHQLEAKCREREGSVNAAKASLEVAQHELEATPGMETQAQQTEDINTSINVITEEIRTKRAELLVIERAITTISRSECTNNRSQSELASRKSNLLAQIEEMRVKALGAAQNEERALLERIQRTNTESEELNVQAHTLEEESKKLTDSEILFTSRISSTTSQLRSRGDNINRITRELENLRQHSASKAVVFGSKAEEILQKIAVRHFEGPVVGPVGLHVAMNETGAEFADGVERVIGGKLSQFIVTNSRDSARLLTILRESCATDQHQIAIQPIAARYNVVSINCDRTVLNLINVDNDLAFNFLVDQTSMERVIVTHSEEECEAKYIRRGVEECFIDPNVASCVTKDGVQIQIRHGNRSSQSNANRKRRIGVDTRQRRLELEQQREAGNEELQALSRQLDQLQCEKRTAQDSCRRSERRLQEKRNEIRSLKAEIRTLSTQLAAIQQSMLVDTTPLEGEIESIEQQLDLLKDERLTLQTKREQQITLKEQQQRIVDEACARENSLRQKLDDLQKAAEHWLERHAEARNRVAKCEDVLKMSQQKFTNANQKREVLQRDVDDLIQIAIEHETTVVGSCIGAERIEQVKSEYAELERKCKSLTRQEARAKERAAQSQLTFESVQTRLNAAQKDFLDHNAEVEGLKQHVEQMLKDVKQHKKKWTRQLRHCSSIVGQNFDEYMQRKGFSGAVDFVHEDSELKIRARTDNQDVQSQVEDVRQLSGGERSFTTLALLLALGHVIDCPFRVFDEYDVFMDQVARTITLCQLLEYAKDPRQDGRQFIIITPQDLSAVYVSGDETVRVSRLLPPDAS